MINEFASKPKRKEGEEKISKIVNID